MKAPADPRRPEMAAVARIACVCLLLAGVAATCGWTLGGPKDEDPVRVLYPTALVLAALQGAAVLGLLRRDARAAWAALGVGLGGLCGLLVGLATGGPPWWGALGYGLLAAAAVLALVSDRGTLALPATRAARRWLATCPTLLFVTFVLACSSAIPHAQSAEVLSALFLALPVPLLVLVGLVLEPRSPRASRAVLVTAAVAGIAAGIAVWYAEPTRNEIVNALCGLLLGATGVPELLLGRSAGRAAAEAKPAPEVAATRPPKRHPQLAVGWWTPARVLVAAVLLATGAGVAGGVLGPVGLDFDRLDFMLRWGSGPDREEAFEAGAVALAWLVVGGVLVARSRRSRTADGVDGALVLGGAWSLIVSGGVSGHVAWWLCGEPHDSCVDPWVFAPSGAVILAVLAVVGAVAAGAGVYRTWRRRGWLRRATAGEDPALELAPAANVDGAEAAPALAAFGAKAVLDAVLLPRPSAATPFREGRLAPLARLPTRPSWIARRLVARLAIALLALALAGVGLAGIHWRLDRSRSWSVLPPSPGATVLDLGGYSDGHCALWSDGAVRCFSSAGGWHAYARTDIARLWLLEPSLYGGLGVLVRTDGSVWQWNLKRTIDRATPGPAARDVVGADANEHLLCVWSRAGDVACEVIGPRDPYARQAQERAQILGAALEGAHGVAGVDLTLFGAHVWFGDGTLDELFVMNREVSRRRLPLTGVRRLVSRRSVSCVLGIDGSVRCRSGYEVPSQDEAPIAGLGPVVDIGVGEAHACALDQQGTVRCWGSSGRGQLGNGHRWRPSAPVVATLLSPASRLAVAGDRTCVLLRSGELRCAGN